MVGEFNAVHDVSESQQSVYLSDWSQSKAKRAFDCACVLVSLPLLTPLLLMAAAAVWLTSRGPVLFRQQRMGRLGRCFTILKFRTMVHTDEQEHRAVATVGNEGFTAIGPFLRRWKLDELPQLWNVLKGDMSLVGPRPKMLEHSTVGLCCRPGITGAATIAFAREEVVLSRIPEDCLDEVYHSVVLPAKLELDEEYMAEATFASDLGLLVNTVLRKWDASYLNHLVNKAAGSTANQATRDVLGTSHEGEIGNSTVDGPRDFEVAFR
jgi:lipopolysaccharide/colanic/teichoic acid biosynthesis glycosyltransferase